MSKPMIPVFLAEPTEDGLWRAWCPFCRRYHTHSPEPGHHVAHCHRTGVFPDGFSWSRAARPTRSSRGATRDLVRGARQRNPGTSRVSAHGRPI
jgi:hypothetical protein